VASGPLADVLRAWRAQRADGKPAYTVINDRTLTAIAQALPESRDELAQIDGIGPTRLERYGDEILALVREHASPAVARSDDLVTH
jgi:superfamily II DNA helicase RecQ